MSWLLSPHAENATAVTKFRELRTTHDQKFEDATTLECPSHMAATAAQTQTVMGVSLLTTGRQSGQAFRADSPQRLR